MTMIFIDCDGQIRKLSKQEARRRRRERAIREAIRQIKEKHPNIYYNGDPNASGG